MTGTTERPLRADAQRNRDQILAAASAAFSKCGLEATLEGIAKDAGVGIGTLYRHFPTRDDLVAAVFHDRIDELEALAEELLTSESPG
ncbi:MAG TPA: helix-turn-helix domain-containing protein, partial [Kribbella sp.]|nr:helix-turn-helix domain-containing protein [Kribbella sp.]